MAYRKIRSLAAPVIAYLLAGQAIATAPLPSGSFAMLDSSKGCPVGTPNAATCYLTRPDQALKVIQNLQRAGVEYFMIPSALPEEAEVIADAIDAKSAKFLTYERWSFEAAVGADGTFDCATYTSERIEKFLIPLKVSHPTSFVGLQLKDEPSRPDHANLGALAACVRKVPALADLKVFVNLLPANANDAALNGSGPDNGVAGAIEPEAYGVSCATNSISDRTKLVAMTDRYTHYVTSALDAIKPDYVAFDLYPFNAKLRTCSVAREQLMTANMSVIAQQANARGIVPIAYLQNYQLSVPNGSPDSPEHASFRDLRWYAAFFYAFGGRGTANFLSHDQGQNFGMLDANNEPRDIAIEQESVFGFTHQVQDALRGYDYVDFVAPWLGVTSGSMVGWLPSENIMASEFASQSGGSDIVIFVTRPNGTVSSVPTGLNKWRTKIERLNFGSGLWETVGQSTNAITVDFGDLPAAVYRLTD